MGRAPCCDKSKVKRGPWSPEEDETLKTYIHNNGTAGNWISLPQRAGLRRCGKSCRLRWLNYLRPDIKHGAFTEEEDLIIFTLHTQIGSRWSVIASQLQGRTDNDVKNRWNTKLKKMLTVTPPITHQTPVATSEAYLPANPPAMPALGPCLTADDPVYFPLDILEFNSRVSESSSLANYGWWSRGGAAGLLADSCGGVSTSNVMDGGSWCQEMLAETNSYMQM